MVKNHERQNISATTMSTPDLEKKTSEATEQHQKLLATMGKQRIQDFLFHKVTLIFALTVLLMLGGIIVSLFIGAWPAFHEFGPGFITRVEWDPVNDQYGALIAIVGTLSTSIMPW